MIGQQAATALQNLQGCEKSENLNAHSKVAYYYLKKLVKVLYTASTGNVVIDTVQNGELSAQIEFREKAKTEDFKFGINQKS